MKYMIWSIIIGLIVFAIMGTFVILLPSDPRDGREIIFSATLADPSLYQGGVYYESFIINGGQYYLQFVPNGDSPRIITIVLIGQSFEFTEEFTLESTRQGVEPAVYYTWDYIGDKQIVIPATQVIEIIIDPHGDVAGPVSVQIISKTA